MVGYLNIVKFICAYLLTLNLETIIIESDEQFYQLCQAKRDVRFERTTSGELIVMPPTGGETGNRNIEFAFQLQAWSRQNNLGVAFDSSTGFKLPNEAERSPPRWLLGKVRPLGGTDS